MTYEDCIEAAVTTDRCAHFAEANISPATGLATDYLNHFNEAIMLLEMLAECPDCIAELLAWRPMSYRERFAQSPLKTGAVALTVYEAVDPRLRESLESMSIAMTAVLLAMCGAVRGDMPAHAAGVLALRAVACLKPLIARADAAISGEGSATAPQTVIDSLMKTPA